MIRIEHEPALILPVSEEVAAGLAAGLVGLILDRGRVGAAIDPDEPDDEPGGES